MKEENSESRVPVRAYTKIDFAQLYNPGIGMSTSLQLSHRWIYANKQLMSELFAVGYNRNRHTILPLEMKLIFKFLGKP